MTRAPGWLPDPTRRHELRYWDGDLWTADVSDGGMASFDPHDVPVTPPPSDAAWGRPSPADPGPPGPWAPDPGPDADPDLSLGQGRAPAAPGAAASDTDPYRAERAAAADRTAAPGAEPPVRPTGPTGSAAGRVSGIDMSARFPPRATTAEPSAGSSPWAGSERRGQRRSSARLVVGLVVLLVALGVGLVAVLVGGIDGEGGDDGSPAATGDAGTSGSDAAGGPGGTGGGVPAGSPTSGTAPPGSDARAVMVAAVAEGIVEGSDGAIDRSQAECMGRALIDEIGLDRLEEVTEATTDRSVRNPLDLLTEEEQNGAVVRMRACVDQATLDSLAPGGE